LQVITLRVHSVTRDAGRELQHEKSSSEHISTLLSTCNYS